ncbi:RIMS-binding protein 2 [Nymphon striatum]|nr:RIMS-binding protein 2 [Nymphon striatum]
MLEMTALRRQQAKQSWSSSQQSSLTDGLTSPESNISTPPEAVSSKSMSNGDSGMVQSYNSGTQSDSNMFTAPLPKDNYINSNSGFGTVLESTSKEIDRIMARIEQDNKVLAELDRPRSALGWLCNYSKFVRIIGFGSGFSMITDGPDFTSSVYENRFKAFDDHAGNTGVGFTLKPSRSMNELDFTSLSLQAERNSNKRTHNTLNNRTRPNVKYPYVNPELDQLMAKLEQDNRVLAELDKTRASIAMSTTLSSHHLPNAISTAPFVPNHHPMGSSYRSTEQLLLDSNRNLTDHTTRNILRYTHLDGNNLILDESAEYIDIPGKGVVQVFVAKYTYDPLIHSPNENPEAELTVAAGEYIVVHGDMDEDGFYNGELLDGRNGLVPSNFVVKLIGEDLYDFQTQVIYGSTKDSDDSGASFSQELDFLDDNQLSLEDYKRMNDYIDLEDIEEVDEDNLSELEGSDILIPPPNAPQRLTLQKQLSKSILIAWLPPDGSSDGIESYQIYVDGILKGTVKSQENTRALLEGVDSTRPHRISVRSVANTGKQSKDASCTITIGKDSPLAPAYVKGTNITSTSAVISWLPSNSNFQHVICVNSVEVRTVKPGIFRHTITGYGRGDRKNMVKSDHKRLSIPISKEVTTLLFSRSKINSKSGPLTRVKFDSCFGVNVTPLFTLTRVKLTPKVESIQQYSKSRVYFTQYIGLAPNTEYRVSVRSKAGKSTPSKSAFNDEKNQRKMERLTAYVDFKTLPKGLPDPPIDVQVDSGPQDSTLLITWLPVTISATGGTSNGCPVTGYSVFVDGKRMSEVESPTSDHTLLDISSLDQTNVKSITVRTKSGESLSGDSISCKVPFVRKRQKRKGFQPPPQQSWLYLQLRKSSYPMTVDVATYGKRFTNHRPPTFQNIQFQSWFPTENGVEDFEDSSDRDELSDIAEEPEEELSDNLQQGKSTEKKTNTTKEGTEKETKKSEKAHSNKETSHQKSTKETGTSPQQRSSKEGKSQKSSKDAHRHQENRSLQKTTQQSSGKKKHEVTERRDSADQIILETEDNLSDKEIMPSSHVAIPSIEITKDSASEGRNSIEPFSDEDYEHAAHGRSRTSTDKYASERHHKDSRERPSNPQSHGRHSQNAHPGQDRGYPDKRGSGPNTQPSRRPVPGYNNGYHRDSDYRHEDDYRKGQTYRKDKDYKRGSDGRRDHNQPYRDVPQQRQFVALFDYDPQTMSPNPDAADEELPFVEGQIITIYGDKDSDGFYRGESCERTGYVPCNMVSEVQLTDEELAHHLLKNGHMNRPRGRGRAEYHSEPWNPSNLRKMVALFDYDPRKSSPNIDAETLASQVTGSYEIELRLHYRHEKGDLLNIELTFNTGDIIFVHGPVDPDGFFMADISGQRGLVPSNYVTDVPADYRDGQRNELVTGKVSHQRRKDPIREGPSGRGPPPPTATNSGFYPSQQGSGHTQLPQDHHNNPRNYAGEKGPYPNERGHYPNERGQHQNDRGPYPSERSQYPSERSQYANERSQYPSERGQYQNERGQYGNERGQYAAGERSQYSADRGKYPSERSQYPPDRMQYPGERSQIPGERSQLPGERSQLPGERSQLPGERSQLPGERSQLPGERSQLPGERSQFPSDRSQLPGDRSQLPSDRSQLPGDRSQLPGDRSQFPGERSQLPGERSQLPGERSQLPGERSQLPSDRSQLPNDRSQFPSERSQYPSERGQHPNDRGQYAGDKVPANRSQYHGERSQIPPEQGQYPNERPGQYQGDKGAYSGPKSQYPNDRIPNQGDRKQYEGERGQYAGSDGYPPRAGSYPQMPHANNSPAPTAEQYSARNQNSQFNNAPSRMPYGQSQKVGAGGKW